MGAKKHLFTIFAISAALTAFIGASASATVLCNELATECTSYGKGATVDASLTETTTTFSTAGGGMVLDTCTFGMVEGATSNAGGASETVSATIEELIWGSCTHTTDTTNKGELEIHWISGTDNGTVTGKNISLTLNTAFGSCTYGTGTALDLGTLTGGSPATIDVNAVLVKQAGGFLCPSEAEWTASYTVPVRPLHIGKSSVASAPILSIKNTGVLPKKGTEICEFAIEGQACDFQITNKSAFVVKVTTREILGTTGRYRFINSQCAEGNEIGIGKSCTAEVYSEAEPEPEWLNWVFIEVEERGSNGKNQTAVVGFLMT